jgi:hypothetical protein
MSTEVSNSSTPASPSPAAVPKSELDVFLDMFRRAGYKEESPNGQGWVAVLSFSVERGASLNDRAGDRHFFMAGLTRVNIGQGTGYSGFRASFYFDDAGKLVTHGVWE